MRKTRCLSAPCSQPRSSRASSWLERSSPSTHRAIRAALWGSLARMARASRSRAWLIWAGEGFWGSFSSGSSVTVRRQ